MSAMKALARVLLVFTKLVWLYDIRLALAETISNIYMGSFEMQHYGGICSSETTLCDIIFLHCVLNIIYQLYGEDNASKLTF